MPWLRSSANKVQTNVFCCCLIVNYGVALHRTCYTIVRIVPCFSLCYRITPFSAWDFLGVNIWFRDFLGFAESPFFFWLLTFGSIRSSPSLEIPSTPPPPLGTDDANQCLHNKSGSHGVPNINLSNFMCLLVDFGKVLCSSAKELQQNSNTSREDYVPQILTVLLEILHIYI